MLKVLMETKKAFTALYLVDPEEEPQTAGMSRRNQYNMSGKYMVSNKRYSVDSTAWALWTLHWCHQTTSIDTNTPQALKPKPNKQ